MWGYGGPGLYRRKGVCFTDGLDLTNQVLDIVQRPASITGIAEEVAATDTGTLPAERATGRFKEAALRFNPGAESGVMNYNMKVKKCKA
ncbi:MAG: hypothetical protein A2Y58_03260 [Chloroflexi bacterium RBG_13_51_52]|nr:MAG: hypothetical protein A2Y58_03260 [Chloroflexi bacterium RBG_13_51_52]